MLKLLSVIVISALVFSCAYDHEFEKKKEAGYKTQPQTKDTWFVNPEDKIDPYGSLSRDDYMKMNNNTDHYANTGPVQPKIALPEMSNLLSAPSEQKLVKDKLVSISVNEDTPLKDVIVELARRAEVDVEVDKNISGGIIFIAKDKPFTEVIDRICKMADLTYSYQNGTLRVYKDVPVLKNYKFNLLDLTRSSESNISTSLSVTSTNSGSSGGGGSGGGSTGGSSGGNGGSSGSNTAGGNVGGSSDSKLTAKSGDGNIWSTITTGINQILALYNNGAPMAAPTADAGAPATVDPTAVATTTPAGGSSGTSGIVSINKNAGMISVIATEKQHRAIKEYLDKIDIELTSQVLIEAKIVEVTLSDQYSTGINWTLLMNGGKQQVSTIFPDTIDRGLKVATLSPIDLFGGDDQNTLAGTIKLLQTFGTTRSLSNPRISALNNQFAVLNFSRSEVYFSIQEDTTAVSSASGTNQDSSVTSTINSVPIGMILTLQPSIDLVKNEILMNVHPTLTRVADHVADPGAKIIAAKAGVTLGDDSLIPIVDTRELDTTLRVKSGEIMVIGGLLGNDSTNSDTGLPGVSKIPYIGNVFKSSSKLQNNVETVILIKATIVAGKGVSVEDEEFYKKFTSGRAPFFPSEKDK